MAQLPVEIINLLSDGSVALTLSLTEAARVQDEFEFSMLDSSYSDAMRLQVRQDTHTGTFFDALSAKKLEWRGYHPFIVSFLDCSLHSDNGATSLALGARRMALPSLPILVSLI